MAQAAANAVRVANFGALLETLLETLLVTFGWLMAFIKIITLFNRYRLPVIVFTDSLYIRPLIGHKAVVWRKIVQIFNTLAN